MTPSDIIRHMHEMDRSYFRCQLGFMFAGSASGGLVLGDILTSVIDGRTVLGGLAFGASVMAWVALFMSRRVNRAAGMAMAALTQALDDATTAIELMAEERAQPRSPDVPSIAPGRTIN